MVVDTYLKLEPQARVACETLTTTNKVVLAGETRGPKIDKDELIYEIEDIMNKNMYQNGLGSRWMVIKIQPNKKFKKPWWCTSTFTKT